MGKSNEMLMCSSKPVELFPSVQKHQFCVIKKPQKNLGKNQILFLENSF